LNNNPIKAPSKKEWVKQQVIEFDKVFRAGISERNNDETQPKDVWNEQDHYFHFYHVMMEDSIRVALLAMHQLMDRAELDARNSAERPHDVFELAADLYNNARMDFVNNKYPTLHKDFEDHIFLFGSNAINITPQKLKEKWINVWVKLAIVKKKL
jgi:hypothetical protein